jgi:hypothetical protein
VGSNFGGIFAYVSGMKKKISQRLINVVNGIWQVSKALLHNLKNVETFAKRNLFNFDANRMVGWQS